MEQYLNAYMDKVDFGLFREYCMKYGTLKEYAKKEYFLHKGDKADWLGYIQEGYIRYTCTDYKGNVHIIGYSFGEDFAVDYSSFLNQSKANVDIQVMEKSRMYVITFEQFNAFFDYNFENQRLGRRANEELFINIYDRLLDFYLYSPEERYVRFMKKYPFLKDKLPMKEIASFIGISGEALSRIRKRLLSKNE